jgi:hypothetical protein
MRRNELLPQLVFALIQDILQSRLWWLRTDSASLIQANIESTASAS